VCCVTCIGSGAFIIVFFFFQAEDGIRDSSVTGVQTCALPISGMQRGALTSPVRATNFSAALHSGGHSESGGEDDGGSDAPEVKEIGRASCRERVEVEGVGGA